MTVYRVTDAWVKDTVGTGRLLLDLDFEGITDGSQEVEVDMGAFALIGVIMTLGKTVYYADGVLSTDALFGERPPDALSPRRLHVTDVDAQWNFQERAGRLKLTLENRSRAYLDSKDAALLAGWALTIRAHPVTWDGTSLSSDRQIGTP